MKETSKYVFVNVGNGRLALDHRPGRGDFARLREQGCTHVVTLLKESESAQKIGSQTKNAGMEWVWVPVPNGHYPQGEVHERLLAAMPQISQLLDEGNSLLIHCSAGIHRTGTVAYGLLRWRGVERDEAMRLIHTMRKETAEWMMEKRRRWGDEQARRSVQTETNWFTAIRTFLRRLVKG